MIDLLLWYIRIWWGRLLGCGMAGHYWCYNFGDSGRVVERECMTCGKVEKLK